MASSFRSRIFSVAPLVALVVGGCSLVAGLRTFHLLGRQPWAMAPWFLLGLSVAAAVAMPLLGQLTKLQAKDEENPQEDPQDKTL